MKSIWKSMAICLILIMSLTGCSNESGFNWSRLIASPSPSPTAENVPGGSGNSITLAMPVSSGSLNPIENMSTSMQNLFPLLYEGLYRLDERMQPALWLADSCESAEGGYLITLRPNVLFHDGTLLTASHVEQSFAAIGASESSPYKYVLDLIDSAEARGESQVFIGTQKGYMALYGLTFPIVLFPESDGLPSGTGPYKATSYMSGVELLLSANEGWWRKAPIIQNIKVVAVDDPTAELVQIGELDVALVDLMMASSLYTYSQVNTVDYSTGRVELLLPNHLGELGNESMRDAIALLLDRREIITTAFQGHGVSIEVPLWPDSFLAERAQGLGNDVDAAKELLKSIGWEDLDDDGLLEKSGSYIPPQNTPEPPGDTTEPGQSPDPSASPSPTPSPTPPAASGDPSPTPSNVIDELLGNTQGEEPEIEHLSFTLLVGGEDNSALKDTATRLQAQLLQGGITLNIEAVEVDKLTERIDAHDFDFVLMGYTLGTSNDLSPLLHSDGKSNIIGYASAEMDALLSQMQTAATAEQYQNAAQQVMEKLLNDNPFFTIAMRTKTMVSHSNLSITGIGRSGDAYRGIESWALAQ